MRSRLKLCPKARRQHTGNFFGPWMKKLGQFNGAVFGTHFGSDPFEPRAPGLEIRHPNNIVIGHRIGNIFRRLNRKRIARIPMIQRHKRLQIPQIFGPILNILKLHHFAQAQLSHVLGGQWQAPDAVHQTLPGLY